MVLNFRWAVRRLGCLSAAAALLTASAAAFDLQGHRGARGLEPENTLPAFERAIAHGVATLEFDVVVTKDGQLVVTHDPVPRADIVRGADGQWLAAATAPIIYRTLDEVRTLDVGRIMPGTPYAGQWPEQQPRDGTAMPTFDEVARLAKAAPYPVRLNIETKLSPLKPGETPEPEAFAALVVSAVRSHDLASRATIQSFDWRTLKAVNRLAPDIATVCLTIETQNTNNLRPKEGAPSWTAGLKLEDFGKSTPRLVKAAGCAVWSPFWRNVDQTLVAEAKALGLKVVPWTVNSPDDMGRLIESGVDGLITDYPDRGQALLKARGLVAK